MAVAEKQLEELKERYDQLENSLQLDTREKRLAELEPQMASPEFWDNQERAQRVIKEVKALKSVVDPLTEFKSRLEDVLELYELAAMDDDEEMMMTELEPEVKRLEKILAKLEVRALLSEKHDHRDAFLSIQSGAGGVDASDFAQMLLRMYARYAEQEGFKTEVIEVQDAEEAGIKSATLKIMGTNAYGLLKSEIGVHRLVRISPFDANNRRQTSFAAVDVTPVFDDDIEIELNDKDLRIDTYRAGGAGGQHVNKTSSAVRITYLPNPSIVVQCQNERSQHANKRTAMAMLKAKLYQIEEAKREAEIQAAYDSKGGIEWGHQIRNYVLHPYNMVKDRRTNVETSNTQAVLDGDIEQFIEAFLKWRLANRVKESARK